MNEARAALDVDRHIWAENGMLMAFRLRRPLVPNQLQFYLKRFDTNLSSLARAVVRISR